MLTFTLVYFFVLSANFCLEIVEWRGVTKKLNYGTNKSISAKYFLFGVKLSDYHNRMKTAASRSSAKFRRHKSVPVFCAIGMKNWRKNLALDLWHQFLERVSEALYVIIIKHCR